MKNFKDIYHEKFCSEEKIFRNINRGDRIFVGTGCGEPQYLVKSLINYVERNPNAFFDTEIIHVWTLGVAPYADEKFKYNFRHNSFFIGTNTRSAVNEGNADYTPIFLSSVPSLFRKGLIPIDIALIQTSYPDKHGYMSLGVSVDIVKSAIEVARIVIAQINSYMPRVHGDTFINIKDVHFIVQHDEPILEYEAKVSDEIAFKIGNYVAKIIENGNTIQVGYGSIPNAILSSLKNKKHLGIHTELLSDGIVELMKLGVVDNTKKNIDRGKTVASFCMGKKSTYEYINDNPAIEFRTVDYTNNPLIISRNDNMVAINSALEIDLTGQSTAESLGRMFYSGIGGQADFMRGALLAKGGKSILAIESTANDGKVSRIVPFLKEGAGVTLNRGDIHYVVTEYGIAYLHGKNIRERAMDLISIAHPKFRGWLIEEARKLGLIYKDQAFIFGKSEEYPEHLENLRTTKSGLQIFLRPVKISDEPLLKEFFNSLSDESLYKRFISVRKNVPHQMLQKFVVIDWAKECVILAAIKNINEKEVVVGVGQFVINENIHMAEVALAVRDDYQNKGIGTELLSYLTFIAKRFGLLGFTAEMLAENLQMRHLFDKMGFKTTKTTSEGICELKMMF